MSYTRSIPGYYANDPYTPTKADEIFDGLSAGKVKEEVTALIQNEEKARRRAGVLDEIGKFLALHPEFDDDEKDHNPNAEYFKTDMKLHGVDPTTVTVQDLRDSYHRLKAAGIPLRLKQDVLRKQREEKIARMPTTSRSANTSQRMTPTRSQWKS
jgi:hypothetical protein